LLIKISDNKNLYLGHGYAFLSTKTKETSTGSLRLKGRDLPTSWRVLLPPHR